MRFEVLPIIAEAYRSHPLHGPSRIWCETNCAADLWIEALHALGAEPLAALAFTFSTDFDGDQWRMFKHPAEDLRRLFGIEVAELNVWRPLVHHVAEQVGMGRLVTVDVDAWHLPDTAGLTYRCAHQKTTVMVQMIDVEARRLGYFHNSGYFELEGEDFDALFAENRSSVLAPYVESIRLDRFDPADAAVRAVALELFGEHLERRPPTNPVARMGRRLRLDLPWLQASGLEMFHRYAFGTLRQCGANAELAAAFLSWLRALEPRGAWSPRALEIAAQRFNAIAAGMKSLELSVARTVSRGKACDLDTAFGQLTRCWDEAYGLLERKPCHAG